MSLPTFPLWFLFYSPPVKYQLYCLGKLWCPSIPSCFDFPALVFCRELVFGDFSVKGFIFPVLWFWHTFLLVLPVNCLLIEIYVALAVRHVICHCISWWWLCLCIVVTWSLLGCTAGRCCWIVWKLVCLARFPDGHSLCHCGRLETPFLLLQVMGVIQRFHQLVFGLAGV